MSKSNDVRFTRDGDQFHYLWAARRCLNLLSPTTDLVAITIEGASKSENDEEEPIAEGEEVIDVGEYFGSVSIADASSVRYIQLKHSTVNARDEWTMSGLENTLAGFAGRFQKLRDEIGKETVARKLSFVFATNRPISSVVYDAIEDARLETQPRDTRASKGLSTYTGLSGKELAEFCSLIVLEQEFAGFLEQRSALATDLRSYLAGGDSEAFLQIKELVTRKATSEFAANPAITKIDILRALGRDEDDLFPATNQIQQPAFVISRSGEPALVKSIVDAETLPVIVHAEGGVGKSVFASQIGKHLPKGSVTIVYDCFGSGQYREPSHPRHGARQALVQVANELAAKSLCHPIIPSAQADEAAYFRAFRNRLEQAIESARETEANALLCIVIDAADNAEMAAEESGVASSFARKLLRETLPLGVRLVMMCRTHRRYRLKPPPAVIELTLTPFSWDETASKLRAVFSGASDQDVDEFHRLSSQNPRVQATALAAARDLHEMLRDLGPEPKTVDDMIGAILDHSVKRAKEEVPIDLHSKFDRICTALAVLRPMVPLAVVASLAQIEQGTLRSFLSDFGQAVVINGDLLQFRDEPTETWFQEHFKPDNEALRDFIALLRPQAISSSYVAATLPHLLMRAGQLDELIRISLTASDLPESNTLERREIEAQRLHFAVRASLRSKRYADAAKLALSAASLAATEERQWRTIQSNTDLAGYHLEAEQILGVVSGKQFAAGWRGSHHVFDASILSSHPAFQGDAQSHIRMANNWLNNIRNLPPEERDKERIEHGDLTAFVLAHLNVYGPERAVAAVGRCRNPQFRYNVASSVADRLVDAGRLDDLDALAKFGSKDTVLVAALVEAAMRVGHVLPREGVMKAWRNISRISPNGIERSLDVEGAVPAMLTAFSWTVLRLNLITPMDVSNVMERHLGVGRLRSLGYSHDFGGATLIKAFALKAKLAGKDCLLMDLAHPSWHAALTKGAHSIDKREILEFRARAGALLPWYKLWAEILVDGIGDDEIAARLAHAESESSRALELKYWEKHELRNSCAIALTEVLFALGDQAKTHIGALRAKLAKDDYYLSTRISIAWIAARSASLKSYALEVSNEAARRLDSAHEQAESRVDSWISLSRALLSVHDNESKHFFQKSIEVASKIGDENLWRWGAMIHLANAASSQEVNEPKLAFRMARSAELAYDFVYRDKHFDWNGTVEAIANLCPSSAFAILSRWRDRDFGSRARLLAVLVRHLARKRLLRAELTAALYGFQADWSASEIFDLVLERSDSNSSRQVLSDHLYYYFKLEGNNNEAWAKIRAGAEKYQIDLAEIDRYVDEAERKATIQETVSQRHRNTYTSEKEPIAWDTVFADLDITSFASIIEARRRYKALAAYEGSTSFYEQAAHRVSIGKESAFLQSLQSDPEFELFELRQLLQRIPDGWRTQFSTTAALQALVKDVVSRNCLGISANRYYQTLPLDLVERETKLPVSEVVEVALKATAETDVQMDAEDLFQLVGLLALRLEKSEAGEALDFELNRLERSMEEDRGDGKWKDSFLPPDDIESAVAGYIWAALASPEKKHRWQAAHVVRALSDLHCTDCLKTLVEWMSSPPPTQFMDSRFVHYSLHAKLWLLIGLARAARANPVALMEHYSKFVDIALNGIPHVLIRGFAARAALAIITSGAVQDDPATLAALGAINTPIYSEDAPTRSARLKQKRLKARPKDQPKLLFGIDMPSYWFEPLANCFGLSTDEICALIQNEIHTRLSTSSAQWDDDQRYKLNYYRYEETQHSHGSYPKSEDLHFYLSFHGMMLVAGELLASVPLARSEDDADAYGTFESWIHDYELTQQDGKWLADRRDPQPFDVPDCALGGEDSEWQWSISKGDFENTLVSKSGMVVVSGRWLQSESSRRQQIEVSSALVPSDSARALLIAWQTAPDLRFTAQLPRSDEFEDGTIDGFSLSGWTVNLDRSDGLDVHDPWNANIRTPSLSPSTDICSLLDLEADDDGRVWRQASISIAALESRTWSAVPSSYDTEQEPSNGVFLQASRDTLKNLVAKTGKTVIFKVSISRRLSSSYHRDQDDAVKYPAPYVMYFLWDENEEFTTL